jgi:hypothetical protein
MVKDCLRPQVRIHDCSIDLSIDEWWSTITYKVTSNRKAMTSLTMPISWTIWKERNSRVFQNKFAPPPILLEIIKCETRLWDTTGAKNLSVVLLGE